MSVRRLLVTGTEPELVLWNLQVGALLNGVARRGQTALYSCMDEHYEWALDMARPLGVTVQELHRDGDGERYETVVKGPHDGWPNRPAPPSVPASLALIDDGGA